MKVLFLFLFFFGGGGGEEFNEERTHQNPKFNVVVGVSFESLQEKYRLEILTRVLEILALFSR